LEYEKLFYGFLYGSKVGISSFVSTDIFKEVFLAFFNVLSCHSPGEFDENLAVL
jgi:hypothetical protein